MSEHPGLVLGALLTLAGACASVLLVGLLDLGAAGIVTLASTAAAALSACLLLLAEPQRMPLAGAAFVLLFGASLVAFARAAVAAARQQRLLRSLPLEPVGDEHLLRVAHDAGLEQLWLVAARRPGAFCFGLLRPRVAISRGLLEQLEPDEQAAAIWHEAHHAQRREPLRCLLARLAAASFFWLPALADLCDRYFLAKELEADQTAARRTSRQALAGALWQVSAGPQPAGTVGLGEHAAARVDRLLDPEARLPPLWRRSRLALSATATAAVATLALFPPRLELGACAELRSLLAAATPLGLPAVASALALDALILVLLGTLIHHRQHSLRRVPR